MAKTPITKKGHDALHAELERYKKVERPKNIKDIEEARGHGDLKENAEYHAAKERQSHIAARISDLEHKLAEAQIIDTSNFSNEKVLFGATVTLKDAQTEKEQRFTPRIMRVADSADRKLNITFGFQRRYAQVYQKAKQLVDSGAIGAIRMAHAHFIKSGGASTGVQQLARPATEREKIVAWHAWKELSGLWRSSTE